MKTPSIFVLAPPTGPQAAWVRELGYELARSAEGASALVFSPRLADEGGRIARALDLGAVACHPVDTLDEGWFVASDAMDHVLVRADAYASEPGALEQALRFVLHEDRDERLRGPLRVTWLGSLGEAHPWASPSIGASAALDDRVLVGRSSQARICLRQGPHSDQNTVARLHALFERSGARVTLRDLGSTNGSWVDGETITEAVLAPGQEVAIAGTHRLRLDGAA